MEELRAVSGSLLVAAPDMLDPNFMHAVVLVVSHEPAGAMGLVLNRPANVTVDALLPDHPLLSRQRFLVHQGGPVGRDGLQFLHRVPERVPGGYEIAEGLFLGGEIDALAEYLEDQRAAAHEFVRLLIGYAGWGEGQLDRELSEGVWLPAPGKAEWVFNTDPERMWRDAVRSIGDAGRGLDELPPDVHWN
jgi:putative transcriptional regulator